MANRWGDTRHFFWRISSAPLTLSFVLLMSLASACSSPDDNNQNGDSESTPGVASTSELLELYKVPDEGHKALVLSYIDALRAQDVSSIQDSLSAYALKEVRLQHGDLKTYVSLSAKALEGKKLTINFDAPYQHHAGLDRGAFYEVWFDKTLHLAFYLEQQGGKLVVDNLLVSPRTRLFIFERIVPAFGMALEDTNISFKAYYYGAIFAQHPADVLAEIKGVPATTKERLAYLRLCSTRGWIDSIKADPDAKGNVLGFLDVGANALKAFSEPIEMARDDTSFTYDLAHIDSSQPARIKYWFTREHGVYRIVKEERVW